MTKERVPFRYAQGNTGRCEAGFFYGRPDTTARCYLHFVQDTGGGSGADHRKVFSPNGERWPADKRLFLSRPQERNFFPYGHYVPLCERSELEAGSEEILKEPACFPLTRKGVPVLSEAKALGRDFVSSGRPKERELRSVPSLRSLR